MNFTEDECRIMINSFRTSELQILLGTFRHSRTGRKSELKERALELLRTKPSGLNYPLYQAKIAEIHRSMQPIGMQQAQPPKLFQQPSQLTRQSIIVRHDPRNISPQVMPQIQVGSYRNNRGNRIPGRNNNRNSYRPAGPRYTPPQISFKQQGNAAILDDSLYHDTSNGNSLVPSAQSLFNIKLKKLPFYKVTAQIIQPTPLIGINRCTVRNPPIGMREAEFKFTLSPEQATDIATNRDISEGKNEYVYQLQIRICLFEAGSTEITDNLPLELHIRINNNNCPLPPPLPKIKDRRIALPIDCTELAKLNPSIANKITVNWIPDKRTYIMGMYLVKKLTSQKLLQKLIDKRPKSSEEITSFIRKKMADFDPDLATTSYRFSLICPIGKIRMQVPAKSTKCEHLQCFDASTFILMNEKKPTWMCPTCNQPCLYDDIQVQSYFLDVILSPDLPVSCKDIELLSDGTWKVYEKKNEPIEVAVDVEKDPIDFVNLIDSDDENSMEVVKRFYHYPENSKKSENLQNKIINLTISDDEEIPKENDKPENEPRAADAVQSVTTIDLNSPAQVQPQQAVNSKESEKLNLCEIDLTVEEEEPQREKEKQGNEAQKADAVQPVNTVVLNSPAHVPSQLAVNSKEPEKLDLCEIDLTIEDEEPQEEKDKQGNEAENSDAVQSVSTVIVNSPVQVQSQQAIDYPFRAKRSN